MIRNRYSSGNKPLAAHGGFTKGRRGVSLIEVLIVIACVAILIGLLLGTIQLVRLRSLQAQSANNLRQIILATHQLADQREGRVKGLTQASLPPKPFYTEQSVFKEILPWTYGERRLPDNATPDQVADYFIPSVGVYVSPADPSIASFVANMGSQRGTCSYACNMIAFDGSMLIPFSIPDGMSSTIAFSERYFWCVATQEYSIYTHIFPMPAGPNTSGGMRRATFADKGWYDVLPVKDPATGQTVASQRGRTFQVRPRVQDADSKVLQTPHPGGLPVAMFDGSVRTLSPSISESVFWSLVTPDWGEVVGDF